jgi:hypothetical protein
MAGPEGFLAIWSDVPVAAETDYLHWLTREHTSERLNVPGFLSVRVFRARLIDVRRYFILYRLRDPGVVSSEPYLARLNAPSEWSRRIMPILQNFVRGGGRVVAEAGLGRGGIAAPIILSPGAAEKAPSLLDEVLALDHMVAARLFEAERERTAVATIEKAMRAGDSSFKSLLLLESASEAGLHEAAAMIQSALSMEERINRYDHVFALTANRSA